MDPTRAALSRNLAFWHWYPELLLTDLTPEQLRWQPPEQDTSITFATWHAYRAADELCHGLVLGRSSVFTTEGWAERLPTTVSGATPSGNGLSREQIGQLDFAAEDLIAYARAVGESLREWLEQATNEELETPVSLPFFAATYPGYETMSRVEAVMFFAVGHTSEHLGEVQLVRGLMGLKGAPL